MSTSDKRLQRHLLYQVAGTAFLALFGAVYEHFSHGVYSCFMLYAFAVPLAAGVALYAVLLYLRRFPNRTFLSLWNAGIACLSVGSVFRGVLEIYGTTNALTVVYPIAGGALLGFAALHALTGGRIRDNREK